MIAHFLLRAIWRMIWFYCTPRTKAVFTFILIWWFSYQHRNSHFKIRKLEHYSLSLTLSLPLPRPGRVSFYVNCMFLCVVYGIALASTQRHAWRGWKGFLCKFVLKSPSFFSPPIDISCESISPRNVLTFIIKNNFMYFAQEIYRRMNVWNFRHIVSYLASTILRWKNVYFMWVWVCMWVDVVRQQHPKLLNLLTMSLLKIVIANRARAELWGMH